MSIKLSSMEVILPIKSSLSTVLLTRPETVEFKHALGIKKSSLIP